METISLPDLRIFLEIAKSLHITSAAGTLRMPKGVVSKSLARLEQRLGATLFERSTRRLAITRAGLVLQRRAEGILFDVEGLLEEIRRDQHEIRGTICIAAPPELGVWLTDGLFAAYLQHNPHVRITLKLDYGFQDLFDPKIDMAFRIGEIKDESLVARSLGTMTRVLVASPEFSKRSRVTSFTALAHVPCLSFSEQEAPSTWALTDGKTTRTIEVDGRFAARSYPAIVAAARSGLGVAYLPDFVAAPWLDGGELVRVMPRWRSPPFSIFVLHRAGHQRSQRVAAMLALIAEHPEWIPTSER